RMKIGFIGQGWIGKNYSNDFEARGYEVVRYSLEAPYAQNKELIRDCQVVFIAVPTPTTPDGFDDSFVRSALANLSAGATAVIKSTLAPGTTERLQQEFDRLFIMHSPEFLVEKTAAYDAAHPTRNIVGISTDNKEFRARAEIILEILPDSPFEMICSAKEAELIKYGANAFLYCKTVYANLLYDLSAKLDCDYDKVKAMIAADPRIGSSHMAAVNDGGRGAGGHCMIKDFESFINLYSQTVGEPTGSHMLESIRDKNLSLLRASGKDLELVKQVYGE
ncbi:hypothetical protein HGA64_03050, partial [Candidatus Falkowbacteria bacterium]|nr:hypothetical protein [Candidatus Falkowbacteria bacterium]